ncbi:tetraspanin family protein [Planctomonas sp. JC2975]|uniref:tetraspanin family protein n=1 Tax=Planctomonas sp. JC2975 TaxID=2729626 RepID=UPI0014733C8C|nr:tetraspanin family protein [Planctomonas sp. JC2975]NNC10847.1 tetraspanin family protein [Planctomonas sp. JC2975]
MTPDEAAAILEVAKDASASDILAAYSKKAQAAGGSGDLAAEKAEVQILQDARVTLMTNRQKLQGTQQRTEVAARAAGKTPQPSGKPEYGERTAAPVESGWPDDAPKGKSRTADEELVRKQRSFIIAAIGLVLSLTAWFWWLLEPLSLFGIGLSIWALIRVRGYGSGMYTGTRIVSWISIVLGVLAMVGNILLVVNGVTAGK